MTEIAVIDHDTGELVPYEHTVPEVTLFGSLNPDEVVREATKHAKALTKVIESQQLFKVIQGKRHILVEAWQALGAMTGVFAVLEGEPEYVEIGGVPGFKATLTATRNGRVIGRATAFCMRDEDQWRNRPTHALASMAQTRATSKALKGPLGFIVKLAGYEATPAEEMPSDLPAALRSDADDEYQRERALLVQELLPLAARLGDDKLAQKTREVQASLTSRSPADDLAWLRGQLKKAKELVAALPEAAA